MTSYPPPSPPYLGPPAKHSGQGNKPINRIVLHGTVSPAVKGDARNIAAYFRSSSAGGSAHYIVDPGEVVQSAYDDVIAWHAPPNGHSIGVEFCDPVGGPNGALPVTRWDDAAHRAELKLGARLVAELCLAYNVPPVMLTPAQLRAGKRGLCEHDDVSDAWGQSSHWDLGHFPRRRFARMVRAEVARIKGDAAKGDREDKAAESRVTKARDLLEAALRNKRIAAKRERAIREGLKVLPDK